MAPSDDRNSSNTGHALSFCFADFANRDPAQCAKLMAAIYAGIDLK
jgi:hypothetical protein